jgi:hypothetical protein
MKSQTSWQDGRGHIFEHIFMDYFDWGVLLSRLGRHDEAIDKYRLAFFFADQNNLSLILKKPRFLLRYNILFYKFSLPPLGNLPFDHRDFDKWGHSYSWPGSLTKPKNCAQLLTTITSKFDKIPGTLLMPSL